MCVQNMIGLLPNNLIGYSNDIKTKKKFILFYFSMAGLAEVLSFISKNPNATDMEIIKKGKKKFFFICF